MKPLTTNFLFNETGCINSSILLKYRDRLLTEDEQHEVEEHLVDCELCSEALEGLVDVQLSTLTGISESVKEMAKQGRKPGMQVLRIAAVIAGFGLVTYFIYTQYARVSDERMALQQFEESKQPVEPVTGTGESTIGINPDSDTITVQLNSEKPKTISEYSSPPTSDSLTVSVPNQKQSMLYKDAIAANEMEESVQDNQSSATTISGISGVQYTADEGAQVEETEQASVTYIDNRKVLDYSQGGAVQATEADKPRNSAAVQSSKKEVPAARSSDAESSNLRETTSAYREELADAIALFNKGRYESALREFGKMLEKNPDDLNAKYYSALSKFHLAKYGQSAKALYYFASNPENPFHEEARYYYALSLTHTSEKDKGIELLKQIAEEGGMYSGKAKEALRN